MKRIVIFHILLFLFILVGCTNADDQVGVDDELPEMTLAELALFDGRNGAMAYVAVNGMVYNVTDSQYWPNGFHNGFQAGQDLTQPLLTQAPHSIENIERYPVVAILVSGQ